MFNSRAAGTMRVRAWGKGCSGGKIHVRVVLLESSRGGGAQVTKWWATPLKCHPACAQYHRRESPPGGKACRLCR